jgi:hypothetical protein
VVQRDWISPNSNSSSSNNTKRTAVATTYVHITWQQYAPTAGFSPAPAPAVGRVVAAAKVRRSSQVHTASSVHKWPMVCRAWRTEVPGGTGRVRSQGWEGQGRQRTFPRGVISHVNTNKTKRGIRRGTSFGGVEGGGQRASERGV